MIRVSEGWRQPLARFLIHALRNLSHCTRVKGPASISSQVFGSSRTRPRARLARRKRAAGRSPCQLGSLDAGRRVSRRAGFRRRRSGDADRPAGSGPARSRPSGGGVVPPAPSKRGARPFSHCSKNRTGPARDLLHHRPEVVGRGVAVAEPPVVVADAGPERVGADPAAQHVERPAALLVDERVKHPPMSERLSWIDGVPGSSLVEQRIASRLPSGRRRTRRGPRRAR